MSFATEMKRLRKLSTEELHALRERIQGDPANRTPPGSPSIYLYTPKARKKLDLIARAISERIGGTP